MCVLYLLPLHPSQCGFFSSYSFLWLRLRFFWTSRKTFLSCSKLLYHFSSKILSLNWFGSFALFLSPLASWNWSFQAASRYISSFGKVKSLLFALQNCNQVTITSSLDNTIFFVINLLLITQTSSNVELSVLDASFLSWDFVIHSFLAIARVI